MSLSPILLQAAQTAQATGPIALFMNFLPMVAILIVFYFLLLRPQQQRMKAHQAMVSALKKGDEIVTSGGFMGKVKSVQENDVSVEIAPNVVVKVLRQAIQDVRGPHIIPPANDTKK